MDTEPKVMPKAQPPTPIDPLRRVFVPRETPMLDGYGDPIGWRFRTTDKARYTRSALTGTIRRAESKPITKKARRRARVEGR